VVSVEDPDAFNEPLHMVQRWRKVKNQMVETVCAENNGDHFGNNLFPIPQADTPRFLNRATRRRRDGRRGAPCFAPSPRAIFAPHSETKSNREGRDP